MANIFKIKVTRQIPRSAEILTKGGERFVRFRRHGRFIIRPLTEDGNRYRDESTKWYVQYKDAEGVWRRMPGYTDKDATLQLASRVVVAPVGTLAATHLVRFRSTLRGPVRRFS